MHLDLVMSQVSTRRQIVRALLQLAEVELGLLVAEAAQFLDITLNKIAKSHQLAVLGLLAVEIVIYQDILTQRLVKAEAALGLQTQLEAVMCLDSTTRRHVRLMHQQAEAALGHLELVAELTLRAAEAAVVFLDILHLKLVRLMHQLVEVALGLQIQKSAQETAHAQFPATTQRRNVKAQDQDKATTLINLEAHQYHLQFGHQVAETTAIAQTLRTQLLHSVVLAAELGHLTLVDTALSQATIQRMHV
jgi:hypothetical protein